MGLTDRCRLFVNDTEVPKFLPLFTSPFPLPKAVFLFCSIQRWTSFFYRLLSTSPHLQHTMSFCWWQPTPTPVSASAWRIYQWKVNVSSGCLLLTAHGCCLGTTRCPHFSHPNLLYLDYSEQLLKRWRKRAAFKNLSESKGQKDWLCVSHPPPREQHLSSSCFPFTVFNSLVLHSLPLIYIQKKKGLCAVRVCGKRRDPSRKSFWSHLAMRCIKTLGKAEWQLLVLYIFQSFPHLMLSFVIQWGRGHISTSRTAVLSPKRLSPCLERPKIADVLLTQLIQYNLAGPHRKAWLGHCTAVCHGSW